MGCVLATRWCHLAERCVLLACKWYFKVEHNNFISKKLSNKYLRCQVLIPAYRACNLQVAHDYQSGLMRVFCFLEFSQQWIIQPVTVQRGISQWQGTGGWLGKMENCDYMIRLNGIKFKLRICGVFSAHVRLQRRRPMTREAGREKGTSMTAIVRVSPGPQTHQSVGGLMNRAAVFVIDHSWVVLAVVAWFDSTNKLQWAETAVSW